VSRSVAEQRIGARLADVLPSIQLTSPPGHEATYSNLGYELLGAIVEQVTGEPHAEFVERKILARYGMTGSTLQRRGQPAVIDVTGYHVVGDLLVSPPIPPVPILQRTACPATCRTWPASTGQGRGPAVLGGDCAPC